MPATPADTDPFTMMAAAAEHVRAGVPEVELEWWVEPADMDTGGTQRRMTVWLRSVNRNDVLARSTGAGIKVVDYRDLKPDPEAVPPAGAPKGSKGYALPGGGTLWVPPDVPLTVPPEWEHPSAG